MALGLVLTVIMIACTSIGAWFFWRQFPNKPFRIVYGGFLGAFGGGWICYGLLHAVRLYILLA